MIKSRSLFRDLARSAKEIISDHWHEAWRPKRQPIRLSNRPRYRTRHHSYWDTYRSWLNPVEKELVFFMKQYGREDRVTNIHGDVIGAELPDSTSFTIRALRLEVDGTEELVEVVLATSRVELVVAYRQEFEGLASSLGERLVLARSIRILPRQAALVKMKLGNEAIDLIQTATRARGGPGSGHVQIRMSLEGTLRQSIQ